MASSFTCCEASCHKLAQGQVLEPIVTQKHVYDRKVVQTWPENTQTRTTDPGLWGKPGGRKVGKGGIPLGITLNPKT